MVRSQPLQSFFVSWVMQWASKAKQLKTIGVGKVLVGANEA